MVKRTSSSLPACAHVPSQAGSCTADQAMPAEWWEKFATGWMWKGSVAKSRCRINPLARVDRKILDPLGLPSVVKELGFSRSAALCHPLLRAGQVVTVSLEIIKIVNGLPERGIADRYHTSRNRRRGSQSECGARRGEIFPGFHETNCSLATPIQCTPG